MSDRLIKSETLTDIADAIRERTETTATINPKDFASHIRTLEVIEEYDEAVTVDGGANVVFTDDYTEGYEEGYEVGFEEGKKAQNTDGEQTETTDDYANLNALVEAAPFLKKIPYFDAGGYSGVFVRNVEGLNTLVVILPFIEEIEECGLDGMGDILYVVFTSKTPPVVGWMGWWSSDGMGAPPFKIFVPDESVDAYKTTTNLAEFANKIKPLSEYNGEGYEQET